MGLKVLIIGGYPVAPGEVYGGVESANSVLVPALANRGDVDRVTILRFHNGEAPVSYRREGPKVDIYYIRGQHRCRMLTRAVVDLHRARRLVSRLNPDVVHGQEIGIDGDIATRLSPNCVVTVHGITYVECRLQDSQNVWNRLRGRLIFYVAKRVLRRAKATISISKYDSEEVAGLVHRSLTSIPNAVADEFFALAPATPTPPLLLFAGVLTQRKNPLGLVEAFARVRRDVPAARLALIGPQPDPAYAKLVRDRIEALNLTQCVDVIAGVGIEQMCREISKCRAVVLFSRQETAPTIIAQAMAAGKPVIASRVGGIAEMVDDGETGYLVDSEDEAVLADRLVKVLADQALCLRMGERGHQLAVDRFTAEAVAEMTVDVYRKAMM